MMPDAVCNLHTGYQGHGKTLMTIAHVEALRLATGRKVFYSGIRELTLDWTEFGGPSKDAEKLWWTDPSEWYKLPTGAIIVIDEAQRLFRPRGNGSAVPEYEQQLETLRHNGHTLFLITQHPSLIGTHVRRLCGVHRHFMRKLGSRWVTIHEWAGVRENCDKTRKDSLPTDTTYPKQFFDKYKSAEVHTVKFAVPWKLVVMAAIPLCGVVLFWYLMWGRDMIRGKPQSAGAAPSASSQPFLPAQNAPGSSQRVANGYAAPQSAQAMLASLQPRIPGLPHTAPRYDELTAPVRVPVIVGCWLQGKDQGFCITQQGSRVQLPREFMAAFIERGAFVDFEPGVRLGDQQSGGSVALKPAQVAQ